MYIQNNKGFYDHHRKNKQLTGKCAHRRCVCMHEHICTEAGTNY